MRVKQIMALSASSAQSDRRAALHALSDLLTACFTADELRRWAAFSLPRALNHHLPSEPASLATLVHSFVELLESYDLLNKNFFAALTAERATCSTDIADVQALLGTTTRVLNRVPKTNRTHADEHELRCRAALLRYIRTAWIEDYYEQSLRTLPWIDLEVRDRPDLIPHPAPRPTSPLLRAKPAEIAEVYQRAQGNLLLLGDPGAGKTIALLTLTRTSIELAERDPHAPIPIIFNLSSWSPTHTTLVSWLRHEINTTYSIPRQAIQCWIESDHLVLFLDGLDEVQLHLRGACIAAINEFRRDHLIPVACCARTLPYATGSARLSLGHAVEILPLSEEKLAGIIADDRIRNLSLRPLFTNPLMLELLAAHSNAALPVSLAHQTIAEQRDALLASYLERMLVRQSTSPFPLDKMRNWLACLACNMTTAGVSEFRVERMQPIWLPHRHLRLLFVTLSLCLICISYNLLTESLRRLVESSFESYALNVSSNSNLPRAIITPSLSFAVLMIFIQSMRRRLMRIDTYDSVAWSFRSVLRRFFRIASWTILPMYYVGFAAILSRAVTCDVNVSDIPQGALTILLIGLLIAFMFSPIAGVVPMNAPGAFGRSSWVFRTIRHAVLSAAVAASPFGLVLLTWTILTFNTIDEWWYLDMYVYSYLVFLVFLLAFYIRGGDTLLQHAALRVLLATFRILPWRLYTFLDHCVDRGLLRRVGNGFMFMHHSFQEHLAPLTPRRSGSRPCPTPTPGGAPRSAVRCR